MQRERVQQCVLVSHIVVVTGENMCRIVAFEAHKVRNLVAIEIQNVVYCVALLKKKLRAIEVLEKRLALLPPRSVWIEMCSREILISGQTKLLWRRRELMPYETIHPLSQRLIERRLQISPQGLTP